MMKDSVEFQLVGMALKAPENTQIINVKPKYFKNPSLGALYGAIQAHPTMDYTEWLPDARKHGYDIRDYSLQDIADNAFLPKPNYFQQYAKTIYKDYLRRQVARYAQKLPTPDGSRKDFEALMQYASLYEDSNISNRTSSKQTVEQYHKDTTHNLPDGLKTGYKQLDYVLGKGLLGGTLLTIGAATSVGKTAFAVNIASRMMQDASNRHRPLLVDYFTEEMTPKTILHRFISCRAGVSDYQLMDPHRRITNKAILANTNTIADSIYNQGLRTYEGFSLSQIVSTIHRHAAQRKPNTYLAIIDHIGIVHVDGPHERDPRYLQIGELCREMKNLTTQLDIPIIMQSQVNRKVSGRDSPELELSDLNESGAVEQDSNTVLLLYRDKKSNRSHRMVKVAKNRSGMNGKIPFIFSGGQMRFTEADHEIRDKHKSENTKNNQGKITFKK